jgi:hypothetical protein
VEPVVRLLERAVQRKLPGADYRYITSLDFRNAFNTLKRRMIAAGLLRTAPGLYKCARWAYQKKTRLIVPGDTSPRVLYSSEGVRQGDPIGPFLFSVAYRPILESLEAELGSDFIVVAYLDDTYILSKSIDPLPLVKSFFNRPDTCLDLNESKCRTYDIERIQEEGLEVLGTCIGPETARRTFLNKKVDAQIAKLEKLALLPQFQHSLLIFRACYQQDLRHLQRSLDTSDLGDIWDRLDTAYSNIISQMRSSGLPGRFDKELISLPVKMGGMGILNHRECSVHARAACVEAADRMLIDVLEQGMPDGETDEVIGQGDRCREAFTTRRDALLDTMDDLERKSMVENGSVLARKWLTAIPYNSTGELSNFEISCALHYRTLHVPTIPCPHCAAPPSLGHDELCRGLTRPRYTIIRHNAIVNAIADTLKTIRDTTVEIEPATTDHASRRRNDLRVIGSVGLGNATTEHDVKVYSILGDKVHKSTGVLRDGITAAPPIDSSPWDKTLIQMGRYLEEVRRETVKNVPGVVGTFSALVFSSGGLVEKETWKVLESWKNAVSGVAWEFMVRRMSLSLVRSRARTWEVREI